MILKKQFMMTEKRSNSDNFDGEAAKKRRITDYFEHKDSPHKIWQVAKKGQMQNLISRFPHLIEEIFGLLDYQTLANCSEVNENWYNTVTSQRLCWTQMISKYTNTKEEYHKQWMKATDKTPFDILKRLAELVRVENDPRLAVWDFGHFKHEPELSLFHILVSEGDIDLFKYVARNVGYTHMFGTKNSRCDGYHYTPLHEAASIGNFDICKFIIDQVDDKNPANDNGYTPFHMAANYYRNTEIWGHFEICQLIFEATGFQNPSNEYGLTPLCLAAYNGNLQICKMIIEKLDDKNPATGSDRNTPLHNAAKQGHFEICKLIIGKVVVKNPRNIDGETPLHHAAENCHFEICQLIINDTIEEKNPSDNRGNTPLHHAAKNSNLEICKLICGDIVDKNPKNNSGLSPLDHAYEKRDPRVLYFLIGENNLQY